MKTTKHHIINSDSVKKRKAEKTEIQFSGDANNKGSSESQLLEQLAKMEEIKVQLENRVKEDTKKLNEVISTNAKFLSIVAHDLRNPFNSIIGVLDILSRNLSEFSIAELENLIQLATSSATNTLNLLDNLLAWSIIQNKQKSFNPEKINLRELVINELKNFNLLAAKKQIKMDHSITDGLYITADIQMVKTIFRNLIGNAIKYSKTGGVIFISAEEGKQFVEIAVRDDGIGMSKKTKEKLFKIDEFKSMLGTNNEQGTGLGLLFCQEFIETHGGKIRVESEQGRGSKFRFTLPHYI